MPVALALSDARTAGESIARRYAPECYALAYRLLQNREDALDCTQDAFVRIFRNIQSWRGDGSLKAWVMKIVANEAFRHRRRRRAVWTDPSNLSDLSDGSDPSDGPVRRESGRIVRKALFALPDGQRETLTLRHFGGLSLAEIAAERGCALGTVKATLFTAYEALRRTLPPDVRPEV